jgi:hypothetical protein
MSTGKAILAAIERGECHSRQINKFESGCLSVRIYTQSPQSLDIALSIFVRCGREVVEKLVPFEHLDDRAEDLVGLVDAAVNEAIGKWQCRPMEVS